MNAQVVNVDLKEDDLKTLVGGLIMTVGLPLHGKRGIASAGGLIRGVRWSLREGRLWYRTGGDARTRSQRGGVGHHRRLRGHTGLGVFLEPFLPMPLSRREREISYGIGATVLFDR